MNIQMLNDSQMIAFECTSGSHAYGLSVPTSDVDIRGVFAYPHGAYDGLDEPVQEVSNESQDIKYYELRKYFQLLLKANPGILEYLFMPPDCIRKQTPLWDKLVEYRQMFMTKKCYHTYSGYAYAQIKKAKGQFKMVNNPQLAVLPRKEDFCWFVQEHRGGCGYCKGEWYTLPVSTRPP